MASEKCHVDTIKDLLKRLVPDYHEMTAKDYVVISSDPFALGNLPTLVRQNLIEHAAQVSPISLLIRTSSASRSLASPVAIAS